MRRWAFVAAGLLIVGLTWNWLQGAKVPDGTIDADDYAAGVTAVGSKVLSDLQALETAVNSIDSGQVDASANIQGSKLLTNSIAYNKLILRNVDVAGASWMFKDNAFDDTTTLRIFAHDAFDSAQIDTLFEQGVLQTETAGQKKVAYGDLWLEYSCPAAAYNCADTVQADSSWTQYIDFADSSDVGDPGFPAAPTYMSLSRLHLVGTPAYFNQQGDAARRDSIGLLTYEIVSTAAAGCSVHFFWGGHDTIGVAGYKLYCEAKE